MPTRVTNVEVWEHEDSRQFDANKVTTKYTVKGTDSEVVARAMLDASAPSAWTGDVYLFREPYKLNYLGVQLWEVEVSWGKESKPSSESQNSNEPNDGSWELSWDTTGGTTHINQSLSTLDSSENPAVFPDGPPDFKQTVGASRSGVAGCDVVTPQFQWHETRQIPRSVAMTFDYLRAIYDLTGKINDAEFRGFPAGNVLFLGSKGKISGKDPRYVEVQFTFSASPDKEEVTIGSCNPVDKGGWDYLWVYFHESKDENALAEVKIPAAVYVEKVYESGDFSTLLIGV